MTTFLGRSAWTSSSASGATLTGGELVGVAVHWPGTSQAAIGAASQSSIASRLRSYRSFHVNQRGWRDIGYNLAIDQAGRVWMLRSIQWKGNLVGAHCASASAPRANHKYVGVLLLLGASETPSAAMVAAFRDWYHDRFLPGWPGRTDVRGHGQVVGAQTSCPGSRARAAISEMTKKPSGGSTSPPPPPEDDMTPHERQMLEQTRNAVGNLERLLGGKWHRFMNIYGAVARVDLGAIKLLQQVQALLAANDGLDTDAILARIDQVAAAETAERQALADKLDTAADPEKLAAELSPLLRFEPQENIEAALREVFGSLGSPDAPA